jgi:hypothetical protein
LVPLETSGASGRRRRSEVVDVEEGATEGGLSFIIGRTLLSEVPLSMHSLSQEMKSLMKLSVPLLQLGHGHFVRLDRREAFQRRKQS